MHKTLRKIVIETLKVLIAVVLLAWVLSKTSWNDYVAQGKQEYSLQTGLQLNDDNLPPKIAVTKGFLFWKEPLTVDTAGLDPVRDSQGDPLKTREGAEIKIRPGFKSALLGLDGWLLALAVAGFLLSMLIMSVRYWFLLKIQEIRISLWESLRLTFLGTFFNYFMPGSVGGDLVKAYFVAKHTQRKAAVLVTTFVDRLLGLTELVILAAAMILLAFARGDGMANPNIRWSIWIVLIAVGLIVLAMTFLLSARFRRLFHLQAIYQRLPIAHHIAAAGDAAKLYRSRIGDLAKAICITFGAQIIGIASVAMVGLSLHIHLNQVPLLNYFIYVPIIWMLAAIPISPGGAGWVESLYVGFFAVAGLSPSTLLVLALLARFTQMGASLPGLVVYFTGSRVPKADALEAELHV